MSTFWSWAPLGVGIVVFGELVRLVIRLSGEQGAPDKAREYSPTKWERVYYRMVCVAFVAIPVFSVWLAISINLKRVWGVAYLMMAGLFFVAGIAAIGLPRLRGRAAYASFILTIEHQLKGSFGSFVRLWIVVVVALALFSIPRFIRDSG